MTVRIINGDCRTILPTLDADSFDCVVTSPPYWGLRSYLPEGHDDKHREIGLEPTLDAYVETMAALGDDLWRVLKPEGTFWLNLGDSYARSGGTTDTTSATRQRELGHMASSQRRMTAPTDGLKPKDLCGVPWRVAFALQARGWWLRSAIVWAKPNPMPESVTDRPTSAYEMVFLLTKAERYFYDADAVKEEETSKPQNWTKRVFGKAGGAHRNENAERFGPVSAADVGARGRNARNVWFGEPNVSTEENAEALQTMRSDTSARGVLHQEVRDRREYLQTVLKRSRDRMEGDPAGQVTLSRDEYLAIRQAAEQEVFRRANRNGSRRDNGGTSCRADGRGKEGRSAR